MLLLHALPLEQVLALVAGAEVPAVVQEDGCSLAVDGEPVSAKAVRRKDGPDLLRSLPGSRLPRHRVWMLLFLCFGEVHSKSFEMGSQKSPNLSCAEEQRRETCTAQCVDVQRFRREYEDH